MTDEERKAHKLIGPAELDVEALTEEDVRAHLDRKYGLAGVPGGESMEARDLRVERILSWSRGMYEATREVALCVGLPSDLFEAYNLYAVPFSSSLRQMAREANQPVPSPMDCARRAYELWKAQVPGWAIEPAASLWVM